MNWHAAYCEPRRELYARDNLAARGFEVFCPFERVTRRRCLAGGRSRMETVDLPVFPRYLFVRTRAYMAVEATPGVGRVVGISGRPLVVPDRIVELMRVSAEDDGLVEARDITKPSFGFAGQVGMEFRFNSKSILRDLTGRISSLARLDETGEILAWVQMLGGEREISIPVSAVGSFIGLSSGMAAAA